MDLKQLGMRIRSARLSAKLTQKELSARSGISQGYIAKLENGDTDNPGLSVIMEIANKTGKSAAWLLYEQEDLEKLTEKSINIALLYEDMTAEQKAAFEAIALVYTEKLPPEK